MARAVLADPVCAAILERLPALGIPDWWLTAGAVFQNVWNHVERWPPGTGIKDYDIFYFDADDLSWGAEEEVIRRVASALDDVDAVVEVRNQARVHLWYPQRFGVRIPPFVSSTDAIGAFAASTCCVGVTRRDGEIVVHAPFGTDNVLDMHLRPNPRIAPREVYEAKLRSYRQRWRSVTGDPWPAGEDEGGLPDVPT